MGVIFTAAAEGKFNWYGFLIAAGIVLCFALAYFIAKYRGLDPDMIFDIAIVCVPSAIVGARVYFLIFESLNGAEFTFLQAIGFANGKFEFSNGNFGLQGLAIYGGVLGGVLGGFCLNLYYKKKGKHIKFTQMMDLAAPLFLVGQCIGRWGNFANQELYGAEILNSTWQFFPIAVNINGHFYQALFFYESFFNLIGACLLLYLYIGNKRSFPGFIMAGYCIWYGFTRLILEGMRQSQFILYLIPDVLPVSQFVSVVIILVGVISIIAVSYKARQENCRIPLFATKEEWAKTGYAAELWGDKKPIFARESKVQFEEVDEEDAYWMEGAEGSQNVDGKKSKTANGQSKTAEKKVAEKNTETGGSDDSDKGAVRTAKTDSAQNGADKMAAKPVKSGANSGGKERTAADKPVKKEGMTLSKAESKPLETKNNSASEATDVKPADKPKE